MLYNLISAIADTLDPVTRIGGSFDWITPLSNEVGGYNHLDFSGAYEAALAHKMDLEAKGIACRLEPVGRRGNVYTREEVK